ncbi:MAG: hypothetical protein ACW985_02090 [Candidatus Thorarchaeota archaeon]
MDKRRRIVYSGLVFILLSIVMSIPVVSSWQHAESNLQLESVSTQETPGVIWERTYGGPYWDWCSDLVEVSTGGYAMAGFTDAPWASQGGVLSVLRTDSNGDLLWNYTYSGHLPLNRTHSVDRSSGQALIECSTGGFALAGYAILTYLDNDAIDYPMLLVRIDAEGNHLWNRTFGEGHLDKIVECSDGGFALMGTTERSGGAGRNDYYLARTDTDGNLLWESTYGGSEDDNAREFVACSDDGFAIIGSSYIYCSDFQMLLVRTDSEGTLLWSQTYGGSDYDSGDSILELDDGFLFVGHGTPEGLRIFRTDSGGNIVWLRKFISYAIWHHPSASGFIEDIVRCRTGGFAFAGYSQNSLGQSGGWLMRVDETGNILWDQHYPRTDRDEFYELIESSEGGFVLAGETEVDWEAGDFDFWLVRVSDQPAISWSRLTASAIGAAFALVMSVFVLRRKEKWPGL